METIDNIDCKYCGGRNSKYCFIDHKIKQSEIEGESFNEFLISLLKYALLFLIAFCVYFIFANISTHWVVVLILIALLLNMAAIL